MNASYLCLIQSWIENRSSCYHNPFNLHMKVFNINLRVSYNVIKLQQKKSNNNLSILQLLVLCSLLVIVSNFRGTSTSSIITSKFVLHGEREKFFISMYFQLVGFDQILFLYHTHCKIQQIPNLTYFYYQDYENYVKRISLRSQLQWILKKFWDRVMVCNNKITT